MTAIEKRIQAACLASANAAVPLRTIGQKVRVLRDDGTILETTLRHLPWQLGHGVWVAKVEGISGGYDCSRITPLP